MGGRKAGHEPEAGSAIALVQREISRAIVDRRILPGTRLSEGRLADALGVSRARVREALGRIEAERLAVSIPNRGTFVISPSLEEIRDLLDARRVIETEMVRRLADAASPEACAELRGCVEDERVAWTQGDRHRAIACSRNFHLTVTALCGNRVLAETLGNVLARTSVAAALHLRPHHPDCLFAEHVAIVDAIQAHDGEKAVQIMRDHLDHLERTFEMVADEPEDVDFAAIFAKGKFPVCSS